LAAGLQPQQHIARRVEVCHRSTTMIRSFSMAWLWALHMVDVSRDAARREILCKGRLVEGHPLLGTFVKSASHQGVEILRAVGFDFIVIDQAHAPLGREAVMIG